MRRVSGDCEKNVGIQTHNVVAISRTVKREGVSDCKNSEMSAKKVERSNETAIRVAKQSYTRGPLQSGTTSYATIHPSDSVSNGICV